MIDPSKFADYPTWVKLLVLVWAALTIFLVALLLWKPFQKAQKQPLSPAPKIITKTIISQKEQTNILLLLFEQGELLTFQIAQNLNIKEDIIKYHLWELAKIGFIVEIDLPGIGPPGQTSWYINDSGKKYLIENKLIS